MALTPSFRRLGFSVIDLVVTTAMVGMLVALTLPVIYSAQQAAQRLACQAKLRDLGLAVLRFEAANGALPPGGYVNSSGNGCLPDGLGTDFDCFPIDRGRMPTDHPLLSWIALCLPQLGYQALYDQFDFNASPLEQPKSAYLAQVEALVCPANANSSSLNYDGAGPASPFRDQGFRFSKANYAAWVSPQHIDHQGVFPAALGGFTLGSRLGQTLKNVSDGTSRTLLASEVRAMDYEFDHRGVWSLPFPGSTVLGLDWHHRLQPGEYWTRLYLIRRYIPDPNWGNNAQTPNSQSVGDALFSCAPQLMASLSAPCLNILDYLSAAPRSNHPGGVNVVTLDGRTAFMANDTDGLTFAYLVSSRDRGLLSRRNGP